MRGERLSSRRLDGQFDHSRSQEPEFCIVRCCSDLIASETNDPRLARTDQHARWRGGRNAGDDAGTARLRAGLDSAEQTTHFRVGMLDELNQQSLRLLPGKNIHFVKHIRYDGNLESIAPVSCACFRCLIKNSREAMVGVEFSPHYRSRARSGLCCAFPIPELAFRPDIAQAFRTIMNARKIERQRFGLAIGPIGGGSAWRKNFAFPVSTAAARPSTFRLSNRANSPRPDFRL